MPGAGGSRTICSTRPRRTETMMAASSVSRNTMKKIGTEKRLPAIVREGGLCREGALARGDQSCKSGYIYK